MILALSQGVLIDCLPMPPSLNQAKTIASGRRFLIKSNVLRDFETICSASLASFRVSELQQIKKRLQKYKFLTLEITFNFSHEKLFTKKNTVKKLDVTNRVKYVEDIVSKFLEIDDSKYFDVILKKRVTLEESVSVKIYKNNSSHMINSSEIDTEHLDND